MDGKPEVQSHPRVEFVGNPAQPGKLRILAIGKNPDLLSHIDDGLATPEHLVLVALSGRRALTACKAYTPSLILLDLLMEGPPNGLETLRILRASPISADVPRLLLVARRDALSDPEILAEESMVGPFVGTELLARVQAMRGRSSAGTTKIREYKIRELRIDIGRRDVRAGGSLVDLTGMEFDLLQALAQAHGKVVTRESLLTTARGWTPSAVGRSVDVHMAGIRRKLGAFSALLETVRGVGYRLRQDDDEELE